MPKRIPGIYMIKNKLNGKVYIGESVDIRTRFKRYVWAVNSETGTYNETKRSIVQAMREYGIENFDFYIIKSGDKYKDINTRLSEEAMYIAMYKSDELQYGYNKKSGGQGGPSIPRDQSFIEKYKRAKPIFEYDTKTGHSLLFLNGAKAWGDYRGFGKDVSSHNLKRGSLVLDRYYLIYARSNDRKQQYDKIYTKKILNSNNPRSHIAFNLYAEAVKAVDKAASEFGLD